MRILGNVLWFLLAGLALAVSWFLSGLLFCITVIGIPLGLQCFKFARLALFPFGKEIVYGGPSVCGFLANVLWLLLFGWSLALLSGALGLVLCVTVVGIPFGLQCFKFASLAFFPFGKEVVYGGGGFSFLVNLIWIIFFGLEMAIGYCILSCLWCITILGIPIGKQCFKMAKLSLMPFGATVV